MSTLIQFIVALCEIYCVVFVIGAVLSLFYAPWRPTLTANPYGSVGGFIVALAVVIVFGHHNLGF